MPLPKILGRVAIIGVCRCGGKGKLKASRANFKLKLVNGVLVLDAVENHPLFNGFALSRSGPETKIFPCIPCAM